MPDTMRNYVVECISGLLLFLIVFHGFGHINKVGETALSAVLPVVVVGHEDAGAANLLGALSPQPSDLALVPHIAKLGISLNLRTISCSVLV